MRLIFGGSPPSGPLYAQNAALYDLLEIGLQYVVNTNRNVFHDYAVIKIFATIPSEPHLI